MKFIYMSETEIPILHQLMKWVLRVGHIAFAFFMLLAPFLSNNPETLLLHAQLALFLFMKWTFKEWECGFTMVEYRLRGIKREESFMYSLLHPIVDIHEYQMTLILYVLCITLGMYSYYRFSSGQ